MRSLLVALRKRSVLGAVQGVASLEFPVLLALISTEAPGAESLAPLVVTGDKLAGYAQQVSGSVTLLGPEQLEALSRSSNTYQDFLALCAGAYAGNPGVGTFSLRGLNQDNVFGYLGTGSNALINVMMDGAPLSPSSLRYLPPVLWDLAGAEVLRGPQSLSFGPNSLGGALLLQPRLPGFDADGKALSEVSEEEGLRLGLAQDFTLLPDGMLRWSGTDLLERGCSYAVRKQYGGQCSLPCGVRPA